MQSEETWKEFIEKRGDIVYGGVAELYFEEDDFDAFLARLNTIDAVDYVHPALSPRSVP